VPYVLEVDELAPEDAETCRLLEGKRNLFFVGQISRHKGIDLLVESCKSMRVSMQTLRSTLWSGVPPTSGTSSIGGSPLLVCRTPTNWKKFEPFTAQATTARLAEVLVRTVRSAARPA
jgi:hypothetical protein